MQRAANRRRALRNPVVTRSRNLIGDSIVALNGRNRSYHSIARVALLGLTLACASALHAAPPTISSVDPPPVEWVVDGSALETVTLEFSEDVIVPNGAISARTLAGGSVFHLDVAPLAQPTRVVTVTFGAVRNNRVTLTVDFTITNAAGEPLDGEVDLPTNPLFPTGDGEPGGQAVFQLSVLQGDVNRDGIVDSVDLSLLNAGVNNYNANADLNEDGIVDAIDQGILLANAGALIPKTDKVAPLVLSVTPSAVPLATGSLIVTFSEAVDAATLSARSIHMIGENGQMLSGSAPPVRINDARYEFPFTHIACAQNYDVKISRAIADFSGELLGPAPNHTLFGSDTTPPTLECPPATFVNSTDAFSVGLADISTSASIQSFLNAASASDGCTPSAGITMFTSLDDPTASLPLGVNTVTFSALDEAGNLTTCAGALIVVPAVPLAGPPGPTGAPGNDGADGADGQDGLPGLPGSPCWDLNGDLIGNPNEDINDDGVVDVLDCAGLPGAPGAPGAPGRDGRDGVNGTIPEPPAGSPTGSARLCGTVGMISPLLMLAGMVGFRGRRRVTPRG